MKSDYVTAILDAPGDDPYVYTNYDRFTPNGRFLLGNSFLALTEILLDHGFTADMLCIMVQYALKSLARNE